MSSTSATQRVSIAAPIKSQESNRIGASNQIGEHEMPKGDRTKSSTGMNFFRSLQTLRRPTVTPILAHQSSDCSHPPILTYNTAVGPDVCHPQSSESPLLGMFRRSFTKSVQRQSMLSQSSDHSDAFRRADTLSPRLCELRNSSSAVGFSTIDAMEEEFRNVLPDSSTGEEMLMARPKSKRTFFSFIGPRASKNLPQQQEGGARNIVSLISRQFVSKPTSVVPIRSDDIKFSDGKKESFSGDVGWGTSGWLNGDSIEK